MGLLPSLKTGWSVSVNSLQVLRENKELAVFPFLGALAMGLFFLTFYVGVLADRFITGDAAMVAVLIVYFGTTFTASFFIAALIHAVNDVFQDRDVSIERSLRAVWDLKLEIAIWASIAAFVSLLLRKLEQSNSSLSKIAAGIFSLGWTVTTFFILPVIVLEDTRPRAMFNRSASVFKETWGKTMGAGLGLNLIQFGLVLVATLLAGAVYLFGLLFGSEVGTVLMIAVGTISLGAAMVIGTAIRGIAKTTLYKYAQGEPVPDAFSDFDFDTLDGQLEQSG